jgi:GT2 family glycosyltransferase
VADVAIAIVSWNLRDRLAACLESLRADHEAGRAEVWVVDNGSSDGSPQLVREHHPWVRLIACERNLGYGPAVNLVAARTNTTPWLAPANADLRLEAGALAALLEAGARDPGAGALAPRLVLPDGRTQHSVHPFPSVRVATAVNLGLAARLPGLGLGERLCLEGHWNPERPRAVPWAHGALLLVRRRAWEAAGGFDDAMWFYAEDLDLCWRLRRAGFTVRYVPSARVHHEHAVAATAAWGDERHVRSQAAAYAWMRRRRGRPRAAAVAALNAGLPALGGAIARDPARRARLRHWARLHARAWRRA